MTTATETVDHYLAAWNEGDDRRRRELIAKAFTEDAWYVDPVAKSDGVSAIDTMIAGVQQRFAGMRFSRLGTVDEHNSRVRFRWALSPEGGESVVEGTDFATQAGDGRFASITGFFDKLPAHAA
jgi:non-heme chloroperoxidase